MLMQCRLEDFSLAYLKGNFIESPRTVSLTAFQSLIVQVCCGCLDSVASVSDQSPCGIIIHSVCVYCISLFLDVPKEPFAPDLCPTNLR